MHIYLPNPPIEDANDSIFKEVCANFGLAIYVAQLIEHSLAIALVHFDLLPNVQAHHTKAGFDLFMDKNYKSTMGKLINHLKKVSNIPVELENLLDQVREKRNFLAHNYFRERDRDSISIKGCEEMIAGLQSIITLFDQTEEMLDKIMSPFRTKEVKNYVTQQMESWELQAQIRDGRIK